MIFDCAGYSKRKTHHVSDKMVAQRPQRFQNPKMFFFKSSSVTVWFRGALYAVFCCFGLKETYFSICWQKRAKMAVFLPESLRWLIDQWMSILPEGNFLVSKFLPFLSESKMWRFCSRFSWKFCLNKIGKYPFVEHKRSWQVLFTTRAFVCTCNLIRTNNDWIYLFCRLRVTGRSRVTI